MCVLFAKLNTIVIFYLVGEFMNDTNTTKERISRIISAYGYKTSKQLFDRLDVATGFLSNRIARNTDVSDIVIRFNIETAANIKWLTSGIGELFNNETKQKENTFQVEVLDFTASAGNGFLVLMLKKRSRRLITINQKQNYYSVT